MKVVCLSVTFALRCHPAELAQLVERTTLNRVVEGSIPSFGAIVLSSTTLLLSTTCAHLFRMSPNFRDEMFVIFSCGCRTYRLSFSGFF